MKVMNRIWPRLGLVLLLGLLPCSPGVIARGPIEWVWSGAVTESSAVVKAKVGDSGEPRLLVGEAEIPPSEISASGIATFHLEGLSPGTAYDYRVAVGDGAVLGGRFRTFVQGPSSFRFVFGSCARTGSNHRIFETMESLQPLFTLHMGDFHYENIAENDPAKFRRAFDKVLASERQSSLYRSAPIAYIWDDHDYGPNDADGTHPGKPAAVAAYGEYVPHYPLERDEGQSGGLRQAFTVGRIRFLLTDVRSNRVPDDAPDGPEKTMLGVAQRSGFSARSRPPAVATLSSYGSIPSPGSRSQGAATDGDATTGSAATSPIGSSRRGWPGVCSC